MKFLTQECRLILAVPLPEKQAVTNKKEQGVVIMECRIRSPTRR